MKGTVFPYPASTASPPWACSRSTRWPQPTGSSVPVQAEYLPAKGLEQLLSTISKVKRQLNPKLQIDGILLTMVDSRTNFAREIAALLRETYGSKIKVFGTEIPHSVRAKETSAEGKSIYRPRPRRQGGGSL